MSQTSPFLPTITVAVASRALAEAATAVINEVYDATEGPLWRDGEQRTDVDELLGLMESGAVLVAQDDDGVAGAVMVKRHDIDVAEFGMLAVAPRAARRGLGAALVRAAEAHAAAAGAARMEIVVLRPASGVLAAKELLGGWYPRLGYALTRTAAVTAADLPLDLLVTDCVLDTYVRAL